MVSMNSFLNANSKNSPNERFAKMTLPMKRDFQTTAVRNDIDSAAKFIGAGAATVGIAGSGKFF